MMGLRRTANCDVHAKKKPGWLTRFHERRLDADPTLSGAVSRVTSGWLHRSAARWLRDCQGDPLGSTHSLASQSVQGARKHMPTKHFRCQIVSKVEFAEYLVSY